MAEVTQTPPGTVENDVTAQTVHTSNAVKKAMNDPRSMREIIAGTYNVCRLEGPVTSLYSNGPAALFYGNAKLTADGLAQCKDEASSSTSTTVNGKVISTEVGSSPGFGDEGCFANFVGAEVPADGQVIATFCLVQQNGQWKVHGAYFSKGILAGDDKAFIVQQLNAFAKKS